MSITAIDDSQIAASAFACTEFASNARKSPVTTKAKAVFLFITQQGLHESLAFWSEQAHVTEILDNNCPAQFFFALCVLDHFNVIA